MGNLERSLAFAGLAMVAACDDTAAGSKSFDAGDIGVRDLGFDVSVNPFDEGVRPDEGLRLDGAPRDAALGDAPLNAEFLCSSNADCLPLQYCRQLGEDVGSVCRDNPTGPNDAVQPDVDLCGDNQDCPEGEYCHIDGTVNGSACVENPTGLIERPDAGTVSPRLDASVNPPTPDGAVVRPDGAVVDLDGAVVRPDGAVVDLDGAVVRPDGAVVDLDGAVVSADAAGVDAASDAGDASSDAGDAEPDVFAGPFPPLVDAAGTDAAGIDAAGTDAAGTDAAGTDAAGIDAAGTDAAGIDAAGTDAAGIDAAGIDAAGTDAAGIDAAGTDAAGTDAAGTDAAGTDAAGIDAAGTDAAGIDAAGVPEEPCGGPCPEGELCDPVENVCAEPNCTVNEDCADPNDRCFVEGQGPGEGVCVSPDIELALEVGHADGTIHGLSTTNLDRQSWNVPPEVSKWSGNLDTRDQGVALLVPAPLEALTAHCGDMARCVLAEADNGLFSRVPRDGVTFGPNEDIALPGGVTILTVEDVRSAAAAELAGTCFFADRLCQ